MAFQSDPVPPTGAARDKAPSGSHSDGEQQVSGAFEGSSDLADAMVTKGPPADSDLVPVDPDPGALSGVRVALVVEAILLAVLGVWGLIAALTTARTGPSGPAVLVFHLTWPHALILLATALLALGATRSHAWALRFSTLQAVGYGVLFIVGAGARNWIADPADDVLHACLAIIGLILLMWTATRALGDVQWVRRRTKRARETAAR
jgi:hypothetical protein